MQAGRDNRALRAIVTFTAYAGGIVLLLMMLTTVADVVLRYLFNAPFSGTFEIVESSMSIIVYCGLAYCGLVGGHIVIGVFDAALERPEARHLNVAVHLLGALVFALIAWQSGGEFLSSFRLGERSNTLRIPEYPFYAVAAAGAALYALVLLSHALNAARRELK